MTDAHRGPRAPLSAPQPSPLTGRNVLVTGGSGAFGQAFVRRALDDGATKVSVFSRSESKQAEMRTHLDDSRLRWRLGDVRNEDRLVQAMRDADIVIHAAAQKRIDSCQADPGEAMWTNVVGTYHVAQAAIKCGVKRAVFLSTDKSAGASTVYGASKLFGEGLWNAMMEMAAGTPTIFAATRYGNVIGSTGSVVPIWRAQAAAGGPLTITDSRATRFVMSLEQAVDLVVFALANMQGGEVFIPRIRAARMTDLAQAIAPGVRLREIGMRGLEKLHETLITEDEFRLAEILENHYVIRTSGACGRDEMPAYRSDSAGFLTIDELQRLVAA